MLTDLLQQTITKALPFSPTAQQAEAIGALSRFLLTPGAGAFVLRGYAGTGKTSVVGALVRALQTLERPVVLLAPTGRAAKVMAARAGTTAYTIHKMIYRQRTFQGEHTAFSLGYNKLRGALFIVDEASMIGRGTSGISGGAQFGSGCLLDDLIRYVTEGAPGCRMLLVGDTAQLPPVGEALSPALNRQKLEARGLNGVTGYDLTDVVRQAETSGVLYNATGLRQRLTAATAPATWPRIIAKGFADVCYLPGSELIETLEGSFHTAGREETIVITRSNKRAVVYNQGIRARILGRESELPARGDLVMAVKNNYFWAEQEATRRGADDRLPFDFIANGDVALVEHLSNVHEMHSLRFADATLRFPDYDGCELTCRVLLDTLWAEAPALTPAQAEELYERVMADYADIPSRRERLKRLRQDPYYNALQIKYAYAVTCHKAQGGQWAHVYVDQGYPGEAPDEAYVRWLYTAITRCRERLYLVNWPMTQRQEGGEPVS